MARGTVLQMVKTAPQDKKVLGDHRECSANTDQYSYYHLLLGSYRPTWYAAEPFDLWGLTDYQHLTNG